jgi:hypothetical protein
MSEPQQYTLHWRGRESGPFSLGQIKRKIASGEVSLEHEILVNGHWTTLSEFLASQSDGGQPAPTVKAGNPAPATPVIPAVGESPKPSKSRSKLQLALWCLLMLAALVAIWIAQPKRPLANPYNTAMIESSNSASLRPRVKSADEKPDRSDTETARNSNDKRGGAGDDSPAQTSKSTAAATTQTSASGKTPPEPSPDARQTAKQDDGNSASKSQSPPDSKPADSAGDDANPSAKPDLKISAAVSPSESSLSQPPSKSSSGKDGRDDASPSDRSADKNSGGADASKTSLPKGASAESSPDDASSKLDSGNSPSSPSPAGSPGQHDADARASQQSSNGGDAGKPDAQNSKSDSGVQSKDSAAPKASLSGDSPSSDTAVAGGSGGSGGNSGGNSGDSSSPGSPMENPNAAQASSESPDNSSSQSTPSSQTGAGAGTAAGGSGGGVGGGGIGGGEAGGAAGATIAAGGASSGSGGKTTRAASGTSAPLLTRAATGGVKEQPASDLTKSGGANAVGVRPGVVFLVDQSYSMRGAKGDAARRQLGDLVSALGANTSFYILFFHSSGFDPMPSPAPLPATPENVQAMLKWSSSVRHVFGSQPAKAVARAFDLNPKTMWLISDGKFSKSAVDQITASNKTGRVEINTIGVHSPGGQDTLRDLAGKNGGVFRFVPAP